MNLITKIIDHFYICDIISQVHSEATKFMQKTQEISKHCRGIKYKGYTWK